MKKFNDELFTQWINNMEDYDICLEIKNKIDYKKHSFLIDYKDYITPISMWIIGGDGFAYDIGYGGLDHVLATDNNVNILILDTEIYSNTGGQSSKSSNLGSVASFSSNGKNTYKKDLAKIAMCYPNVYVASTNIGYNKQQYLNVLAEANNHKGPSLIIAYCPCIEHGIKDGMDNNLNHSLLATKCGYFPTFRFNPLTKKFSLDSKDIDFDKYIDFLKSENRFNNIYKNNPDNAKILLEEQINWAKNRYESLKKMEL